MRHIVICGLPGSTIFSAIFHKRHNFRENVSELKMIVLIFSTSFIWNISHCKESSARSYHKSTYVFLKNALYCFHDLMKLYFLDRFSINIRMSISNKSGKWKPTCFMRMDGRTERKEMTKLIVAFGNFVNAPKGSLRSLSFISSAIN